MTTLAERPAPGASAATAAAETDRTTRPAERPAERPGARPVRRLVSLDAVRGLAVVGMLLVNNSPLPSATPEQLRHAGWEGFHLADLVFPLFLFATGAAMPFSAKAQQPRSALKRTLLLFLLGVLLITAKYGMPGPSGVLQHIAIAYLGCWLVTRMPERRQLPTLAAGMLAWWALFAWLPVPGTDPGSYVEGHTFADWLDTLTYGHFSDEGWRVALSSVPSVYAGVIAGRLFRADERRRVTAALLLGYAAIAGGLGLLWSLAVPVSKPLWSPPFTLIAAGLCFLLMAAAYVLVDHFHWTRPAQPLVVLGANPIVAYVGLSLLVTVPVRHFRHEITAPLAALGGDRFATLSVAVFSCLLAWAICAWLYRRKIFVKV